MNSYINSARPGAPYQAPFAVLTEPCRSLTRDAGGLSPSGHDPSREDSDCRTQAASTPKSEEARFKRNCDRRFIGAGRAMKRLRPGSIAQEPPYTAIVLAA